MINIILLLLLFNLLIIKDVKLYQWINAYLNNNIELI